MFVEKRNGQLEEYDQNKIKCAITLAFNDLKANPPEEYVDSVVEKIDNKIKSNFSNNKNIPVETIQDIVEKVLMTSGYKNVAKQYIIYREQHKKNRETKQTLLNYQKLVDDYLKVSDWRVKENSTVSYSLGGLILSNSGAVSANYWLSEVYDDEIANAHKNADIHIHDLSMISGYCAGWNLKQLITEGLGGVPGKITSSPAKHLSTLCNQMVNFLGILQNEWAGAQAFSSFDTYLAPFVKVDNLSYKETKQAIQSFIYGVNTPSRWGCVPIDTEVLSVSGWKKYNELTENDYIYTWNMASNSLEENKVNKVVIKPFDGKLHSYVGGHGYEQLVTPEHRMLVYKHNSDETVIKHSEDIFSVKTAFNLPTLFNRGKQICNNLSDDEIELAAMLYTDGCFDFRGDRIHKITLLKSINRWGNEEIERICSNLNLKFTKSEKESFGKLDDTHKMITYTFYGDCARKLAKLCGSKYEIDGKFLQMNEFQAKLFLETWAKFDGDEQKMLLQCDNKNIVDAIQHIALLAGYTSYVINRGNTTVYVKIRKYKYVCPKKRTEVEYNGLVWCPSVDNGTAVFRRNGNVFISGQSQAPFTNVTLDWTVPNDLAYLNCVVGGKEIPDLYYKDCQKEMDMINKAFIETMIEGDANGRGFQYPIPTYSITKDFDWSDTENNRLLFEMTAKYGTPYFSNYINSDMDPSDIRSMCLVPSTEVWAKLNGKNTVHCTLEYLYNNAVLGESLILTKYGYRPIKEVQKFGYVGNLFKFTTDGGHEVISTPDHEHVVYDDGVLVKKKAINLKLGDEFSLRHKNPGENRRGMTYEEFYGKEKAQSIISTFKEQRAGHWSGDKNPAFGGLTDEWRKNISKGSIGHYVSEECREKSSKRWQGKNNPYNKLGARINGKNASISPYEKDFYDELAALNIDFIYQYYIKDLNYICDFYLPENNLIVELETDYRWYKCSYNSTENIFIQSLKEKYDKLLESGYNLLIFNPKLDTSSYRQYINKKEKIVAIEEIPYDGFVYDLEVDCDDIDGDTTLYHTFYANEILTGNCCRLRLDLRELRKKGGGFFGSGESTGSIGVVTINLPRIAYLSKDEEEFYDRLTHMMDIAARSLHIKRQIVTNLLNDGLYPYTKRYLGSFDNHFSTIGLVGMNESCLNANWLGKDLSNKECQYFAKSVLTYMREKLSDYQEMYEGELFNLEATPAESTSYRLAKHDREQYPDIITAAKSCDDTPYYTNSSHLPVGYTEDIFSALDIQDELQTLYTSGTVFHAFLGEKLPSWQSAMQLVRKIAENYKLPYYTMSPTYSVCQEHGYLTGEQTVCPICGKPTEVYSRITGYYRPVQNWNAGKTQEFKDRKNYLLGNNLLKKKV